MHFDFETVSVQGYIFTDVVNLALFSVLGLFGYFTAFHSQLPETTSPAAVGYVQFEIQYCIKMLPKQEFSCHSTTYLLFVLKFIEVRLLHVCANTISAHLHLECIAIGSALDS